MLKILGAITIIVSCSVIGYSFAKQYNARVYQVRKLRTSLKMLETEIAYSMNLLPEALRKVGSKLVNPISILYDYSADTLSKNTGKTMELIWRDALNKLKVDSSLKDEELEILADFGSGLGISDREEQLKNLRFVQEQLKIIEINAEDERQRHAKIYQTLGVLIGLALSLILI
ncbi:MAG: stage III sporulation protein SpoIIIAB [Bacillota bacterium]